MEHWNLTSFWYLFINAHGEPCEEDFAVIPESCGGRIACGWIEGRLRIVAMEILPEDHELLTRGKVHALPHLFSVLLHEATPETVRGLFMLPALQLLRLDFPAAGAVETLRDHSTSRLRSLQIHGRQDRLHWTRVDLSALCSLDLLHFRAYAIQVLGGTLPNCWQRMTQLRTFYCSNCMMHLPPTALRNLTSLTSFVAFRQWEMIPCALQHVNSTNCKASWETRHATKTDEDALRDSTGAWSDFQEGPSFICPAASYAFPFEEFVKLGWSNIRKVWLDGNFLTGTIPDNIAEVWPKLESLDLYDNNLEGSIPDSLGRLAFVKLQLQGNRFSGRVPKSVLRLAHRANIMLGLQENPDLQGCSPDIGHWSNGIPGTQIRPCHDDEL